jgi:hypothetical protein
MEINMNREEIEVVVINDLHKTGGGFYTLRHLAQKEIDFWEEIYKKEQDEYIKNLAKKRYNYYILYIEILNEKEAKK